jgi:hypothetical protein
VASVVEQKRHRRDDGTASEACCVLVGRWVRRLF